MLNTTFNTAAATPPYHPLLHPVQTVNKMNKEGLRTHKSASLYTMDERNEMSEWVGVSFPPLRRQGGGAEANCTETLLIS